MDKKYFPHVAGGEMNPNETFVSRFNYQPNTAIAVDPRTVITEWSKDALLTLLPSELYVSQKLFCLADKKERVCTWVPTDVGTNFTGWNCVWKEVYDVDAVDEWVDVKAYNPQKPIAQKVAEAEQSKWKFATNPEDGYWGFFQFNNEIKKEIEEKLNDIANTLIAGSINDDVLSGNISKFSIKSEYYKVEAPVSKTSKAYDDAQGKMLTMMIPSKSNRSIDYIVFQSVYVDEPDLYESTQTLQYLSKETEYEFNDVLYDVYVCETPKMETSKEQLAFNIWFYDKK